MNKLFTRIAGAVLGLTMAIGVGVAISGGRDAVRAEAANAWQQVTSLNDISNNDEILIANAGYYLPALKFAAGSSGGTAFSITDGTLANPVWKVTVSNSDYKFSTVVNNATCYLYLTNTNNGVVSDSGNTPAGKTWSITKHATNNTFMLTSAAGSNTRYLTYANGNFRCYVTTGSTGDKYCTLYKKVASTDYVGSLSVSPNTWTGYDSETISLSSFTVSGSKNGVAGAVTSSDYEFQGIGALSNNTFTARTGSASLTSFSPLTTENCLRWKAKYPKTAGGSEYATADVTLNVTADTVSNVVVTGSMTNSTYTTADSWDFTGITVNAYFASASSTPVDKTSDATIKFYKYENSTYTVVDNPAAFGTCTNQDLYADATYSNVTSNKVKVSSTLTITQAPGVINFGSSTGYYSLSTTPADYTDNLQHTVSASITTGGNVTNSASYVTIGNGSSDSELIVVIDLGSTRVGVSAISVSARTTKQSGTLTTLVYADNNTTNVILSGTHAQSTDPLSTDSNYQIVNANKIYVKINSASNGMQVYNITYQTCNAVQEFQTLTSIAVKNTSTHETTFYVNKKFSTAGLVIVATDNVGFTKDFTSGFTTDYDSYKTNAFESTDIGNNKEVTVSLTIGAVTKTTSYTINVIDPPTYSLVSSQADLFEGEKVIIANVASLTAVGSWDSTRFAAGDITASTEVSGSYENDTAIEFTVRIFGDKIAFQFGTYYLGGGTSKGNASRESSITEAATWTLDENGLWTGTGDWYLQKNKQSDIYACYEGTQNDVAIYKSSKSTLTAQAKADTFIYKYLHMRDYLGVEGEDGDNYCLTASVGGPGKSYFDTAATQYATLISGSDGAQIIAAFKANTDAVKRFNAWASANHKSINLDNGQVTTNNQRINLSEMIGVDSNTSISIIAIIAMAGVAALGGYFIIRRRKEQ